MIRVFISYRKETDGENAKLLYDCLKEEGKIKPELALEKRDSAIENAEKIANAIDSCNFFITFYTTKGKESVWVNQELGYAFNHVRQNRFKIIPIYNNLGDCSEGFMTSRSHNFYKGFRLNEEEPEETMKEIKKYFTEEFSHPIKLDFRIEDGFESLHNFTRLKVVIWITNISSQKIRDATLDFVLPDISPGILNITGNSKFIKTQYNSEILPEFHSNKIESTNIKRINFLLNDILGLNAYEIPLEIEIPKSLEDQNLLFGVYVNIPLFGTIYYQVKMEKTGNDWKLSKSKFHLSNNPDEKIEITTK
ncbi:MAG: toll/interleukin-1 receptor domain-containing protein [Methanophagales archaeon]|nr:toll/interleukin-1 receptor domain-containing protein [Methanophagales archaeon]